MPTYGRNRSGKGRRAKSPAIPVSAETFQQIETVAEAAGVLPGVWAEDALKRCLRIEIERLRGNQAEPDRFK